MVGCQASATDIDDDTLSYNYTWRVMRDGFFSEFEAEGEFYGEERLEQVFKKNSNLPADELCRKIREDLFGFCGTNQQKDDITIVAIKASTSRD